MEGAGAWRRAGPRGGTLDTVRSLWPALLLFAGPLLAAEPPQLVIEATDRSVAAAVHVERLDRERLRVAMNYTGLAAPGDPIKVLVADEATALAKSVPQHIAGYAIPTQEIVVLFRARTTSYPDDGIEELLHHEIAHILIARAAAGAPVPRWLHEGLATAIGGAWSMEDQARVAFEVMVGSETSLDAVDRAFAGSPADARRAYALSGAFVRDVAQRHGPEAFARLFARLREGRAFETSFYMATGERFDLAERRFWKRQTLWHRWIPFITSSIALWLVITLLAVHAIRRRRRRDARIKELWDLQEERERLRAADEGDEVVN